MDANGGLNDKPQPNLPSCPTSQWGTTNRFEVLNRCHISPYKPPQTSMIISTWNVRGLNRPFKQKEMTLFMKKYKIEVMGIVETRVKENKARKFTQKIAKDWQAKYNHDHAYNGRIWLL